jgi:hypothetical protein
VSEEWICTNCEHPYHEPPTDCPVCGHEVVVPREEYDRRGGGVQGALDRARARLLDPMSVDRSLVGESRFVQAAFLAIMLLAVVVAVFLVGAVLFG